jgi:hypothetical protein
MLLQKGHVCGYDSAQTVAQEDYVEIICLVRGQPGL